MVSPTPGQTGRCGAVVVKVSLQIVLWTAVLGALVLGPAGTWAFPGAWALMGLFAVGGLAITAWLHRYSPSLLNERMSGAVRKDQKPWDRILLTIFLIGFCGWLAFMGRDAARANFTAVPVWLQTAGGAGVVGYMLIAWLTFRANAFATPVVKIQTDQRTITTGPYAIVRHPMYAGLLLFFCGIPLLLGSWSGLLVTALFVIGVAYRSIKEEQTLSAELPGYADYLAKVRFRLIPYVW